MTRVPDRFTFAEQRPEKFASQALHQRLIAAAPRKLAFRGEATYQDWPRQLRGKLIELLRMPERPVGAPRVEMLGKRKDMGDHFAQDLVFESEPGVEVPCRLLLPKNTRGPLPVMICLQGHTTGMHISIGEVVHDRDVEDLGGDRDFARQAVRRGYAAIAMEQRAFGLRSDGRADCCRRTLDLEVNDDNHTCKHTAMTALLLGRTILGERVFDIIRACDAIAEIDGVDADAINVMGNSGGGTVAWYAAAVEPRIKGAIVASCFCTVEKSIGAIDHCTDNYLPGMLEWFDFADIAGAIETARVAVVMGRHDPLFPHQGVDEAFAQARSIFAAQGRPDDIVFAQGEDGHRFYEDIGWSAFERVMSQSAA